MRVDLSDTNCVSWIFWKVYLICLGTWLVSDVVVRNVTGKSWNKCNSNQKYFATCVTNFNPFQFKESLNNRWTIKYPAPKLHPKNKLHQRSKKRESQMKHSIYSCPSFSHNEHETTFAPLKTKNIHQEIKRTASKQRNIEKCLKIKIKI